MIMKKTTMRSVLCLAVGCFLIAADVAALAQSPPGNLSPKDFDLACAVAAGAEIGASQNEQNIQRRDVAVTIFVFYLGRLSGRDDSKDWNAIAWGRVAELQQEARSSQMLDRELIQFKNKVSVPFRKFILKFSQYPFANFVRNSSTPTQRSNLRLAPPTIAREDWRERGPDEER
jgi:hypothetical protein